MKAKGEEHKVRKISNIRENVFIELISVYIIHKNKFDKNKCERITVSS